MLTLQSGQFVQQLFLPFGQMGGRFHDDMHNLMSTPFSPQFGHAAATERQPVTGLGSAWDRERLGTV